MLGDEAAAEDTVQDALVLALERPPLQKDNFGGWLNAVVRTLALKRLRGDRRRARREESAARVERTDSTVDSVATAALCKQLVDAVLELDEPYRSAISMRYFDDLPPREIATQLGVPRNTVRARLRRGLVQLRERFDADSEGGREAWSPALLVFAELGKGQVVAPVATASAGGTIGVLAMASFGKWLVAALVVALLGLGLLGGDRNADVSLSSQSDEGTVDPSGSATLATAQLTRAEKQREDLVRSAAVDESVSAEVGTPPWKEEERYPFEVRGRVVDAWGRALANAEVYLAVDAQRFNRDTSTGRDGTFEILFEANSPSVELHLYIRRSRAHLSGMRTLRLDSGSPRELQIDLRSVVRLMGSAGPTTDFTGPLSTAPGFSRMPGDQLRFMSQSGSEIRDYDVAVEWEDAVIEDHEEAWYNEDQTLASFTGTLLAADGEPAATALVFVQHVSDKYGVAVVTDTEGQWKLSGLEPGTYTLHAGGDDYGIADTERVLAGGEVQEWNSKLDRGDELRGRIVGPNDEPLAYLVRAEPVEPGVLWSDTTHADSQGRFAFPNAPRCAVRLSIFDQTRNAWGIPVHVEGGHLADGRERTVELSAESLQHSSLTLSLTTATGEPITGAEVRLFSLENRRGVFVAPHHSHESEYQGRYDVGALPPGRYRLEASSPFYGWLDLGTFVLQPGAEFDFGSFSFPLPGRMVAGCSLLDFQDVEDWFIFHKGQRVDSLAWNEYEGFFMEVEGEMLGESEPNRGSLKVQLPAGSYVLRSTSESIGTGWFPFQIESGAATEFELPFSQLVDVSLRFELESNASRARSAELVVTETTTQTKVYSYKFEGLAEPTELRLLPGTYRVQLNVDSKPIAEETFKVEAVTPVAVILSP